MLSIASDMNTTTHPYVLDQDQLLTSFLLSNTNYFKLQTNKLNILRNDTKISHSLLNLLKIDKMPPTSYFRTTASSKLWHTSDGFSHVHHHRFVCNVNFRWIDRYTFKYHCIIFSLVSQIWIQKCQKSAFF